MDTVAFLATTSRASCNRVQSVHAQRYHLPVHTYITLPATRRRLSTRRSRRGSSLATASCLHMSSGKSLGTSITSTYSLRQSLTRSLPSRCRPWRWTDTRPTACSVTGTRNDLEMVGAGSAGHPLPGALYSCSIAPHTCLLLVFAMHHCPSNLSTTPPLPWHAGTPTPRSTASRCHSSPRMPRDRCSSSRRSSSRRPSHTGTFHPSPPDRPWGACLASSLPGPRQLGSGGFLHHLLVAWVSRPHLLAWCDVCLTLQGGQSGVATGHGTQGVNRTGGSREANGSHDERPLKHKLWST